MSDRQVEKRRSYAKRSKTKWLVDQEKLTNNVTSKRTIYKNEPDNDEVTVMTVDDQEEDKKSLVAPNNNNINQAEFMQKNLVQAKISNKILKVQN